MALNHSPKANRRSIRLREYDYARSGMYFFTVCTHEREVLFGDGVDGEMHSNDFARIVWDKWYKSTTVRHELDLDKFVVMPNPIYGIILLKNRASVGRPAGRPSPPDLLEIFGRFYRRVQSSHDETHQRSARYSESGCVAAQLL